VWGGDKEFYWFREVDGAFCSLYVVGTRDLLGMGLRGSTTRLVGVVFFCLGSLAPPVLLFRGK